MIVHPLAPNYPTSHGKFLQHLRAQMNIASSKRAYNRHVRFLLPELNDLYNYLYVETKQMYDHRAYNRQVNFVLPDGQLECGAQALPKFHAEVKHELLQMEIEYSRIQQTEALLCQLHYFLCDIQYHIIQVMGTQTGNVNQYRSSIVVALAQLKEQLVGFMATTVSNSQLRSWLNNELAFKVIENYLPGSVQIIPELMDNKNIPNTATTFMMLRCCPMYTLQGWRSLIGTWVHNLMWWKHKQSGACNSDPVNNPSSSGDDESLLNPSGDESRRLISGGSPCKVAIERSSSLPNSNSAP